MPRRLLPIVFLWCLASGCASLDFSSGWPAMKSETPLVSSNPFDNKPVSPAAHVACSAGTTETATRVNRVGQAVVTANAQLGMKPTFITIGAPQSEIFHQGTTSVTVTEGLVKQCTEDRQLAAVLSLELGKMVSEREARASLRHTRPEAMNVSVGNDYSTRGSADKTELAERLPSRRRPAPRQRPVAAARSPGASTNLSDESRLHAGRPHRGRPAVAGGEREFVVGEAGQRQAGSVRPTRTTPMAALWPWIFVPFTSAIT